MFDPLTLLAGGVLAGAGYLTGQRHRRAPKTPALVCSCGDGYGIHAENGGACAAEIKRASEYDTYGNTVGYEWVPCPCRAYDGPDPLLIRGWTPGRLQ